MKLLVGLKLIVIKKLDFLVCLVVNYSIMKERINR